MRSTMRSSIFGLRTIFPWLACLLGAHRPVIWSNQCRKCKKWLWMSRRDRHYMEALLLQKFKRPTKRSRKGDWECPYCGYRQIHLSDMMTHIQLGHHKLAAFEEAHGGLRP
jgi:hypothetical protein